MSAIHRCPKCGAAFTPPRQLRSECPQCGIWFHKWNAPLPVTPVLAAEAVEEAEEVPPPDDVTYYGRAAALVLVAVWSFFLAADNYTDPEPGFMHSILLPIHEAGHVLFLVLGHFMQVAGGSLFQLLLPFGIGVAFYLKQRDPFGAAICLWWTGASLVDLSPYIYDALYPKLMLLGGRTGEDGGPHDWIYILETFGMLPRAHGLGTAAHHLGVIVMAGAATWAGHWLWKMAPWRRAQRS